MRAVEAAPKQSETCPPPQPRAHLPLQTTPAPNNCGRRPHCCCGEGRARPHQTQPERRHLPPKVPTRPILHRKTGTQIWPRPVADACSLCGLHDSCTHVAGECHAHKSQIISKHNVACLLIHTAIRKPFKGGGTLHSPHTLRLVSADAGTKTQTPGVLMANLSTPDSTTETQPEPRDWLDLELDTATTPTPQRHPRHVDVSDDIRDLLHQNTTMTWSAPPHPITSRSGSSPPLSFDRRRQRGSPGLDLRQKHPRLLQPTPDKRLP